ncbi:MAG: hypothetical protein KDB22_16040 [Planctomycetales bacterium]|nr:hypothetical protein [Planctomycetales bacterium]
MSEAELYRIEELPADELDGASGAKRKFRFEFIGKAPNPRFPFTVANEVVSNFIAMLLGFEVPTVLPTVLAPEPFAMVLWFKHAASRQDGPPMSSARVQELVSLNSDVVHGAIILDLYLANTDRAFGPQRRNIAFDESGRLVLFDFGNALFYRNREHVGINAGIERLDAVESDIRQMFDKQRENPQDYYFQLLTDWSLVEKWCERLRQIPEYIIETAVRRIPESIVPPDGEERKRLRRFLKQRPCYLFDQIKNNLDLFTGLNGGQS